MTSELSVIGLTLLQEPQPYRCGIGLADTQYPYTNLQSVKRHQYEMVQAFRGK